MRERHNFRKQPMEIKFIREFNSTQGTRELGGQSTDRVRGWSEKDKLMRRVGWEGSRPRAIAGVRQ